MEEIWKDIPETNGDYQVSNFGRVRSIDRVVVNSIDRRRFYRGRILVPRNGRYDYPYVNLHIDKKDKTFKIHRLVAMAFIPNPNNLPCINHKDENRRNSSVDNLEWCTYKYNSNYGTAIARRVKTQSMPILQISLDGKVLAKHSSAMQAAKTIGKYQGPISECARGETRTSYGFKWAYAAALT